MEEFSCQKRTHKIRKEQGGFIPCQRPTGALLLVTPKRSSNHTEGVKLLEGSDPEGIQPRKPERDRQESIRFEDYHLQRNPFMLF
jgi:hypothetical protein